MRLGRRYFGGNADMQSIRYYKFTQVRVMMILLGDIGREADGTFARHRPNMTIVFK